MTPKPVGAIVVGGGAGRRLGGVVPKQFQRLGGRPVYRWSLDVLAASEVVGNVAFVVPAADIDQCRNDLPQGFRGVVVAGGQTRTESVRNGLAALLQLGPCDAVLIHDAARPGLAEKTIRALAEALEEVDAAAPALPIADALKRKSGENRIETVDRTGLFAVQTPQAFRIEALQAALARPGADAVDDLALIEATHAVRLIEGDPRLLKITYPGDMALAERLLMGAGMRTGSGFDVHAFGPGDHVTLCGVEISHTHGLEGHSDADVAWHALTDAILGAAALGDIGDHFPPSDPQWKGAASILFLQHAARLAAQTGYAIGNIDLTLLCEKPRIGPHREAMRASTAEALRIDIGQVSVKATTTEKLGFIGRSEGIAAQASVLLQAI